MLTTAVAALLAWALGSGYYITFHDRLLASLLRRQAEMQASYETRITVLQDALDAAGRGATGLAGEPDALWHDLSARTTALEKRAAQLDDVLGGDARAAKVPSPAAAVGIRRAAREDAAALAEDLDTLEARQRGVIRAAAERIERRAGRLRAALSALGLASPDHDDDAGTGGPFVPLPDDATTIETEFGTLKTIAAHRSRLEAVAARLPLRQPVEGRLDVTSAYGARRDPFLGRPALHTGVDLRQNYGSPVLAVAGGTVTIAGFEPGYGTLVEIDHANGYATRYAHLSSAAVVVGQTVSAGTPVGAIGTTGRSTGPHLHYEIRIAGEPIDPARYLALARTIADP